MLEYLKTRNKGRLGRIMALLLLSCLFILVSSCTDHNVIATLEEDKSLSFEGRSYYPILPSEHHSAFFIRDKLLGRTQGNDRLYNLKFANSEDFLCLSTKEGEFLYSSKAELEAGRGDVSAIYMKYMGTYIHPQTDSQNIADLLFLTEVNGEKLEFSYSEVFTDVVLLYACYDGSPIASEWLGELGRINEHFVFVPKGERSLAEAGDFKSEKSQIAIIIKDEALIESLMFLTAIE